MRKIITSGFSFSGSSAIHDLLVDNGAIAFPGREMRIFSSAGSFSALTRDIKRHGSASTGTIENVIALLHGEARDAKAHFAQSVHSSVARIRKKLGDYYDLRVDSLADELHRSRKQRGRTIEACRGFIDDICNHFAKLTGVSTIVFDQGVRPWGLNRMLFYGDVVVFVCMRDVRDQMIDRMRHSLDNTDFEETLRSQTKRFHDLLAKPSSSGKVVQVWFEDLVMDSSERRRILVAADLGPRVRNGGKFNPIASRRNIGLYRLRPDLAPAASELDSTMLHTGTRLSRRMLTIASDYLRYSASAGVNRAGAYSKTRDLNEVRPPSA